MLKQDDNFKKPGETAAGQNPDKLDYERNSILPDISLEALEKARRDEEERAELNRPAGASADDNDGALFELRMPFKKEDAESEETQNIADGPDAAVFKGGDQNGGLFAGGGQASQEEPEKRLARRFLDEVYDWADSVAMAFVLVILLFTFVLRVVKVDGTSMLPTLRDRDDVIIYNVNYKPQPGDIVVLTLDKPVPGIGDKPLIKRVMAVGGQTVDFDFTTGTLIIDGKRLHEPYILEDMSPSIFASYQGQFPFEVPPGQVFFLGDNRNVSHDSSEISVGCVDARHIMGKVVFRIFPLSSFGTVNGNGQ